MDGLRNITSINLQKAGEDLHEQAAQLLMDTFIEKGIQSWPTIESAQQEVQECLQQEYLCFGAVLDNGDVDVSTAILKSQTLSTSQKSLKTNEIHDTSKKILLGWIGLRPMYEKTWEMHPLVVSTQYQNYGIGRSLLTFLEIEAKKIGIEGIFLGTDDETERTSLAGKDFTKESLFEALHHIKNLNGHPFEFYQKCGYQIVGAIPNANGFGKPDIFMWKSLV